MALLPRNYQDEAANSVFAYFAEKDGNPLVAMPTGTGKSVVIAEFLRRVYAWYPQERVMVLTHVKELIAQNFAKLLEAWPLAPAGIYSAGIGRRETHQRITFAGIASVAKRPEEFGYIGIVLVDEAHLVSPSEATMYQKFFDGLRKVNPKLKVVGLTATAWRLGHGKLHEAHPIFTDICFDITGLEAFNRLLREGYLCPLIPKSTDTKLDADGVHTRGGEFIASELQAAVDKHELSYAALKEATTLAADRYSWLVFCAGVEHAQHVAAIMRDAFGFAAEAVYTGMEKDAAAIRARNPGMHKGDRDEVISWWKQGKLRALTNNNVLTTGIDHPALDCIVVLRPTASVILWVQMLGRGTRPYYAPGYDLTTTQGRLDAIAASHKPNCLVLDFARNTARLGPINDPVVPRKKGEKVGEAPIKLCPTCSTYNHASARMCVFCGHEFPAYGPRVQQHAGTLDLIKADMPVVEVFKIDQVTYSVHTKLGKPPSMRVAYFSGYSRKFQEFVLFEHGDGLSQRKVRQWWRARVPGPDANAAAVPATTAEALALVPHLRAPTHLRVWTNKQYPEILAACFDGTAFGTQQAVPGDEPAVDVAVDLMNPRPYEPPPKPSPIDIMDNDIPF
jgi:DNA repair protein RadD